MAHSHRKTDEITPPGSFHAESLTPPPSVNKASTTVRSILDLLTLRRDGRGSGLEVSWLSYSLSHEDYVHLCWLIKKEGLFGFVQDKVRYDYDCDTATGAGTFVLRMPSSVHEIMIFRVVEEIQARLREVCVEKAASRVFAQQVKFNGSVLLELGKGEDGKIVRRVPDATFKHRDAHWPGVILEVAYSQKSRKLPHLADDYILWSNGSVRAVVALDLGYKTKEAVFSIWRPEYVEDEDGELVLEAKRTSSEKFRDAEGSLVVKDGAGVLLNLKDFATQGLCEDVEDVSFLIDSKKLYSFLVEAEEEELEKKKMAKPVEPLRAGAKKRWREITPQEEASDSGEEEITNSKRVRSTATLPS